MLRAEPEDLQDTTRCGRCADILPDETLTYCPMCGIPFSEVPPTLSYTHLGSRNLLRHLQRQRFKVFFLATLLFLGFWSLVGAAQLWRQSQQIASLDPRPRKLDIYFWQSEEYPRISTQAFRNSVSIAVQAFQDHFGMELRGFEVHMDQVPPQLAPFLSKAWNSTPLTSNASQVPPTSRLSFWERQVFPTLSERWIKNPRASLPVLVTNIPIQNHPEDGTQIQTLHLSEEGHVSGLGHPALVVVSGYRALNEVRQESEGRLGIDNDADLARYLGEFLITHELGHALLGLEDEVINKFRSPASLEDTSQCLMHTDQGGGFESWGHIQARPLGHPSLCRSYDNVLRGFRAHTQAVKALKDQNKTKAREFFDSALREVDGSTQPWVSKLWRQDRSLSFLFGID